MKKWWLILIVPCAFFLFAAVRGSDKADTLFSDQKGLNTMRYIGHQVLLSSGDNSSRVLPVNVQAPGVFRISFEEAFAPVSDSLVNIMKRNFDTNAEWLIEVRENSSDEIVYSFALSADSAHEVIPCRGRSLPENNYSLLLHVAPNASNNSYLATALGVLLLLGGGAAWMFRKRKNEPTIVDAIKEDGSVAIGRFRFYSELQQLQLDGQVTELTGKENQILSILVQSPNEVVDRSRIQKEVWEDEGVVVTRSLDMFISKLRRKLQADPAVNIINVHGKGYRLEIS